MDKIIVTGGAGYIGSHTVTALIQDGFEVVVVDNLSNSKAEILDRIGMITGTRPAFLPYDLSDGKLVRDLFSEHADVRGVVHFAASKSVGESVDKPLLYYRNNLDQMIYLLEAMKEFGVPHMVFSSSCTVYGQPDRLPVTEDSPFKRAESPYGNTKQICEEILLDLCKADPDIHGISLRYFNPVGAHDSVLIGELPRGIPNNLVPLITQTAAGLRHELLVYGSDYSTPDGSAIRDYIHVVDLAKAHCVALKRMLSSKQRSSYEYFNLGTGHGISVLEMIGAFERVNGIKVQHRLVDRRHGDIEKIYADTSYANGELGWKAERDIDEMLRSAWNWQEHLIEHPELTS